MLTQAAVSEVRSRENGTRLPYSGGLDLLGTKTGRQARLTYGFGGKLLHEPNDTPFAEHWRVADSEAFEATL